MLLADELIGRLIPYALEEGVYARNRLPAERPPWPVVGDEVYFRRHDWNTDEQLHRMRVVDVQDPDDTTSDFASNLWQQIRNNFSGAPVLDGNGRPVYQQLPDPWPWVHLRWEGIIPPGFEHAWMGRVQMTFESRVRGAPGWLPLNYRDIRLHRLPGQFPHRPAEAYGPGGAVLIG